MSAWHHHGTCSCCGGYIPCGADYIRRWRVSGECPGHLNREGECGALLHSEKRKKPIVGATRRREKCSV